MQHLPGCKAKNEEEILKILIRNQKILSVFFFFKKSCVFFHTILKRNKENISERETKIGGKDDVVVVQLEILSRSHLSSCIANRMSLLSGDPVGSYNKLPMASFNITSHWESFS